MDLREAQQRLTERIRPSAQYERLPLLRASGRYLGRAVVAPAPVPAFANSAMDGYALKFDHALFAADPPYVLPVIDTSYAGRPATLSPNGLACVRIFTGAPLPSGADSVVIQENTERIDATHIRLLQRPVRNEWVRLAGHDFPAGKELVAAGTRLAPHHLGLCAAAGVAEIDVHVLPRVAVMSNGDELRLPGSTLGPGEIYDANRITLLALLANEAVQCIDLGCCPDDVEQIRMTLRQAANDGADLIVTSGGVSVGDADHVRTVLEQEGELAFWRIALKPGKPLAFGRIGTTHFMGLPGNPVSTFLTYQLFVRPAIAYLNGGRWETPVPTLARLTHDIAKEPGRAEFQRGVMSMHNGQLEVRNTGNQSSGMLSSIGEANCFVVLERGQGPLAAGATIAVLPFHGVLD